MNSKKMHNVKEPWEAATVHHTPQKVSWAKPYISYKNCNHHHLKPICSQFKLHVGVWLQI